MRRPSHGHVVGGHSAGNHHVRQPSPVPSSASSSDDSEHEGDDHPQSSRIGQYGLTSDGTRRRTGRRRSGRGRAAQAGLSTSELRMPESSSAPEGNSDVYRGAYSEEPWTPAVERPPGTSSGVSGWPWSVTVLPRPRRPSPAVFPLSVGKGSWSWTISRQGTYSALIVVALAGVSIDVWKEGAQEDRYCVLGACLTSCSQDGGDPQPLT